jgi:shikimate dehydrogenase
MISSKVLQPLVCCFGDPVAGNPTQFVMSRAAAEAGLDWRFFTAHVQSSDFDAAIRGIRALGLQGFCVLDPYQNVVGSFLDTITESGLALGRVTVGRSEGNSWLGDNLLGQAILLTLERTIGKFEQPHDREEGVVAPKKRIVCASSSALSKAVDVSGRELNIELLHIEPSADSVLPDIDQNDEPNLPVALIVEGRIPRGLAKQLASLKWDPQACFLQVSTRSDLESAEDVDVAKQIGLRFVDRLELAAQEAACNFQFWTGVAPNFELIRESIEEYQAY